MIKTKKMLITSLFGKRKGFFRKHRGVDIRSVDPGTSARLPVITPENVRIDRIVHQRKWGYTIVASSNESDYTFKFIHIQKIGDIRRGKIVPAGETIAVTAVTPYMIKNEYWEHLHFEVWRNGKATDPLLYFEKMGFPFELKSGLVRKT